MLISSHNISFYDKYKMLSSVAFKAVELLNNVKPGKDDLLSGHDFAKCSLLNKIEAASEQSFDIFLTEEDLHVYAFPKKNFGKQMFNITIKE